MQKWKRIVAANGKYLSDGQEKTRWITVGTAFIDDSQNVKLKLDAMPIGQDWSGWLNLFDFDEKNRTEEIASRALDKASTDVPF